MWMLPNKIFQRWFWVLLQPIFSTTKLGRSVDKKWSLHEKKSLFIFWPGQKNVTESKLDQKLNFG